MKHIKHFYPALLSSRHNIGWIFTILALTLAARQASATATNLWWDNNGTSAATSGTWDAGTANWATNATLTASRFPFSSGNFPEFAAGTGTTASMTITVNSALTCAGMATGLSGATVTSLTFSGTGSIAIAGGVQGFYCGPSSADTVFFDVPLTGTGELQQHSSGALALYASNSYSGGTATTGGQFIYYNQNCSFGTGPIIIGGTGNAFLSSATTNVLITNAFSFPTAGYNLNLVGGNAVGGLPGTIFSGAFPLPSSGTITLNTSSTATTVDEITGVISGASALNIADLGTMELGGVNTYTGATVISNTATLMIVGSGQLNSGSYAGNITDNSVFIYKSSANQTLSGIISGSGTLTQAGSGTLILSGANTYTGITTLSNGVVQCNKAESVNASGPFGKQTQYATGTILMNGGTIQYTSANQHDYSARFGTGANQFYYVDVNGQTVSYTNALVSSGGVLTVSSTAGPGTFTLGGVNTYTGITTVNAGATLNVTNDDNLGAAPASFSANQLTLNGGTLGLTVTADDLSSNRGIYLAANSAVSVSASQAPFIEGMISGPGMLTKTNSGNLNLDASNSFTGGLTILNGGVRFNNNYAAGTGVITVTPTGAVITLRSITPPAPTTITLTNPVVLNPNGGFDIDLTAAAANTFNLAGPISGSGYLSRGRASGGGGVVGLSGSNTFSGGVLLDGGTLALGSSNALGTGTLTVAPGVNQAVILEATTPLTGVNAIANPVNIDVSNPTNLIIAGSNDLELAGPVGMSNAIASAVTITNNNTGATIISGPISSINAGIGLTVAGAGTLTLGGANTFSGNTTIRSGTLALTAAGSISTSPALSIAAGATFDVSSQSAYALSGSLSASGAATPATITGASGGSVALGSQPITLTYDGSDPALSISQGTLVLNGNLFTVNSASPLAPGNYVIVQQASGNITDLSGTYPAPVGTAIPSWSSGAISVSSGSVILTIYAAPSGGPFSLGAVQGVTASIPVAKLLGVATSSNPNPSYSIISVTSPTTNGATVALTAGNTNLTYTSAANLNPDTITYTFTDSHAVGTGTIAVTVSPNGTGFNITATSSGGNVTIAGFGIPGTTYYIQQSTNSPGLPPWGDVGTNVADTNGMINFTVNGPLPSPSYYRTSTTP